MNGILYIDQNAFSNALEQTVKLPASLKNIGNRAFAYNTNLENITLPDSVSSLGNGAFEGCSSLSKITIPASVKILSNNFQDCKNLKEVTIEDGVIEVGDSCFKGCTALKNVSFPSSLQAIHQLAFEGCTSLNNVQLPKNLRTLYMSAFRNCSALNNLEIQNTSCSINDQLSSGSLSTVKYGNFTYSFNEQTGEVNVSGEGTLPVKPLICFFSINKIKKLIFDDSIEQIIDGNSELYKMYTVMNNLESVKLPSNLKKFDTMVLNGCTNLREIEISDSVESIGDSSFSGCNNLVIICKPDSYAEKFAKEHDIKYNSTPVVAEKKSNSSSWVVVIIAIMAVLAIAVGVFIIIKHRNKV